MAREMFSTVAAATEHSTRQWYTVPLSVAVHAALLVVVVIIPLMASGALPSPSSVLLFVAPTPPPPPPPAPAPARVEIPAVAQDISATAAPLEAPSAITAEAPASLPALVVLPGGQPRLSAPTAGIVLAPPPPKADPLLEAPRRPGGLIKEPTKVHDVRPVYPAVARAARIEGTVIIEATIGKTGAVTDARVLRSVALLDEAALSAVRAWRYSVPTLNGEPIDVLMTVTVRFTLQK